MATPTTTENSEKPKAPPKNELGISRVIYATGYSFKDAAIWFVASTAALSGALYALREKGIVKTILEKLGNHENSWKNRFSKQFPNVGPIILVSASLGWLSSHFVQIPSSAKGWQIAQDAIDKHNRLSEEKDQLVKSNKLLTEENDELKSALANSQENRSSAAERVLASKTAEAAAGRA